MSRSITAIHQSVISQIRRVIKHALTVAFSAVLMSCGGGGSSSGGAVEPVVDMSGAFTSFVTLGDSIGVGVGFGSTRPWPNLVSDFTGVPLLENRSVQSKTTAWGLGQINALLDRNPTASHILILLGTNDARQGITSAAVSNLQQMADIANQRGVIPVIGTVIVNLREPADDQRAQVITSGITSITGAKKAATRAAIGDGRSTIADGIHPNDAGQTAIAQAFVDALAL